MEFFFKKNDHLLLKLATYLNENKVESIALARLAKEIMIEKRALTNLIYQYNYLNLFQSGLALTIFNDTVNCFQHPHFSINYLTSLIFQENLLFKLCQSFFTKEFTSLADFSNKHFTSTSSMYRQTKRLKKILAEYHLTLNLLTSSCLIGDEKQQRHFYFELYEAAYGLDPDHLSTPEVDQTGIKGIIYKYLPNLPFSVKQKIKLASYISLTRIKQGHYLAKNLFDNYPFNHLNMSNELLSYCLALFSSYLNDPTQLAIEASFLTSYVITFDTLTTDYSRLLPTLRYANTYQSLADSWISEFLTLYNIQLSQDNQTFLTTNLHFNYLKSDLLNHSSLSNLSERATMTLLEKDNPYIYVKTIAFTKHLATKKSFPQSHHLTTVYYLLIKEILFSSHTVTALVLSSTSNLQKKHVEHMIVDLSPVPIIFSNSLTDPHDLVITDYFSPQLKLMLRDETVTISTNTYPTKKDCDTITNAILAAHDKKLLF